MDLSFSELKSDYDRAEYMQNILICRATGGSFDADDESHYIQLRNILVSHPAYEQLIPRWIKVNRNLDQFWQYIKHKFGTYAERRTYIYSECQPLLDFLEQKDTSPLIKGVDNFLDQVDSGNIHICWQRALERKEHDPEGAITIARTMLESVCKHILHHKQINIDENNTDLSELYKLTAKELNLSPEQHSEKIFKQILGGCSGVVNGLGSLRNRHGDAHGSWPTAVGPKPRHAELAINLAGAMSVFLLQTFEATKI